jgi:hypothetical protein
VVPVTTEVIVGAVAGAVGGVPTKNSSTESVKEAVSPSDAAWTTRAYSPSGNGSAGVNVASWPVTAGVPSTAVRTSADSANSCTVEEASSGWS